MAERQARQPSEPSFWDITVAGPVSVTILYEGFLAAATSARRAGDYAKARRHEQDAVQVQAAVTNGSLVALDYLRRKAGCVRFGLTDWAGADSRYEAGRWEDAHDWVIGSFLQIIGGAGAPWLHVHNLVLNWVQAEQSGEWGKLDSRSLHRFQPAAAAYSQAEIESALAADPGVCWVQRPDGKGREIAGISQHLINLFEARQEAVTADMSAASVQHEPARLQAPEPVSLRDDLKQMGWLA
jgi:hypothetical protein